jgi:formate dehydrogenase major subunit
LVERITGIPKDQIIKAADLFTSIRKDGDMKKAGTIIYAVGWTQHSSGSQTIRACGDAATGAGERRAVLAEA